MKSYCTLFSRIKNCFWPVLFKFFFFFCTISFSLFLFFFPSLCSPLCSLFSIAFPCFLLILWWCGGWRLEMGLGLRQSWSRYGGLFAPISVSATVEVYQLMFSLLLIYVCLVLCFRTNLHLGSDRSFYNSSFDSAQRICGVLSD